MRVAGMLADHQATDLTLLETDEVNFELRAAGVPNVWPHAWAIVGNPTPDEANAAMQAWLESFNEGGERRCGVGRARDADGQLVIAALALDAIADLAPLPQTAHLGEWLRLEATMLETASAVEVVVLAPTGAPRTVPSTLHHNRVRASFAVDQPGPWTVQVLPTLEQGPRPVLEAVVFVDQVPPQAFQSLPVPGEQSMRSGTPPVQALLEMINGARATEYLPELKYSKELEAAAQIQADAMAERRRLAHEVGLGTPTDRLMAVGVTPLIAGENVAHASSLLRSHRALWSSPSHRSNILHPKFTHGGVGVADGADGSVWVCVVFAGLPNP